jgi:hypothetical protein
VVRADEKLTAFLELELAISRSHFIKSKRIIATASGWLGLPGEVVP